MLAATDILLGYHSEEGWTAAIHLLTGHYGIEVEVRSGFVASSACPALYLLRKVAAGMSSKAERRANQWMGLC